MPDRRARPVTDESGFTLIELLVYILLLGVVMTIVGSLFAGQVRTEAELRRVSIAVRTSQVIDDSLTTGIRNSSNFALIPRGTDQLVVARVAGPGDPVAWTCRGWYYSAASRSLRSGELLAPYTTPVTEPLGWTLLGSEISPASGTTVFAATGTQLSFSLRSGTSTNAPITVTGTATARSGPVGVPKCY